MDKQFRDEWWPLITCLDFRVVYFCRQANFLAFEGLIRWTTHLGAINQDAKRKLEIIIYMLAKHGPNLLTAEIAKLSFPENVSNSQTLLQFSFLTVESPSIFRGPSPTFSSSPLLQAHPSGLSPPGSLLTAHSALQEKWSHFCRWQSKRDRSFRRWFALVTLSRLLAFIWIRRREPSRIFLDFRDQIRSWSSRDQINEVLGKWEVLMRPLSHLHPNQKQEDFLSHNFYKREVRH